MKYIRQLDALRAIAVVFVIVSHWLPAGSIVNKIPNGSIGVDIFFVLSGFLITRILLENRNKADLTGIPRNSVLRNFYIRRTLRIFPIYYLTIFLLLIFQKYTGTDIKATYPYYLTYTSNFYFFKAQQWDGIFSPLWSLAVEEQFYLFWPWVILFANKRYLKYIILFSIAVGMISQYLVRNDAFGTVLTPACLDSFGLGALLSWVMVYKPETIGKFYRRLSIGACVSFLLCIWIFRGNAMAGIYLPSRTLISVVALWLIILLIRNQDNKKFRLGFIFNNKYFIFFGKISYGLYLYHDIIPTIINSRIVNVYLNPLLPDLLNKRYWGQLYLAENILLLVLISWCSYVLIEEPLLRLKKHFVLKETAASKPTISF